MKVKITKRGWEQLRELAAEHLGVEDLTGVADTTSEPSGHFECLEGQIAWSPKAAMQLPYASQEWHRAICLALKARQTDSLVIIEVV